MEESGKTIRERVAVQREPLAPSWLCDEHDQPVMQYIHVTRERPFRIKIGAHWFEQFGANANGESLYRRAR